MNFITNSYKIATAPVSGRNKTFGHYSNCVLPKDNGISWWAPVM